MTDLTLAADSRTRSTRPWRPRSRRRGRLARPRCWSSPPSRACRTDPEHAADMVTAAEWVAARLRGVGATDVEVVRTNLHPIVYGRIHEAPGAPTALVYCHFDVQPPDPLELWETSPFEPFLRDGRFVGRGVADDKGQLVMHLAALEAIRTAGRSPAVNLTFVFEGEEEFGSESLFEWIAPNRDRLGGGRRDHQRHRVLRGQRARDHRRAARDHVRADRRGAVAGRPALGHLRRRRGEPGQRPRQDRHGAQGPGRPRPDPGLLRRRGRAHGRRPGRDGRAAVRRDRVPGGDGRAGAGRRDRLDDPGEQDGAPDARRQRHVERVHGRRRQDDHPGPRPREGVHAARRRPGPAEGVRGAARLRGAGGAPRREGHARRSSTAATPASRRPITPRPRPRRAPCGRSTASSRCFIREGGSIPVTAAFDHVLGLPVVLLGFTQPACNAHAPNEWFLEENFELGTRVIVRLWDELAALPR